MAKPTFDLQDYISTNELPTLSNISNISIKPLVKIYKNDDGDDYPITFYFLHYDKDQLTMNNYETTGLFRSILIDKNKAHIYSPPKSLPIELITTTPYADFILEELVEGTMINMFWDEYSKHWDIATKKTMGGYCKYYQDNNSTFRDMFLDAMIKQDLEFDDFDITMCYSFVLQHPDNRIVIPFQMPRLVLVGLYKIDGFKVTILNKYECNVPNIILPKTFKEYSDYKGSCWDDLQNFLLQMNLDYRITGVNIYNKTNGLRGKLRNPSYEYVRRLKGNSPKIQFQYYSLRKLGKVGEFLKYYKEYNETFSNLRNDLHIWTNQLWVNYIKCYVKKEKPLLEFPKKFRAHMFNLHQIFLNDLRELGHYISKQIVIKYVNTMEPAKLMYSVNYDLRQYDRDDIVIKKSMKSENSI